MPVPIQEQEPSQSLDSLLLEARPETLARIGEISQNAQTTFLGLLLGCLYAGLTIGTTTDSSLISNAAPASLPIVSAQVPLKWFYGTGPLILFCVYLYFHLYLQELWRGLGQLPSVNKESIGIDDYIYPWLISCSLVRAHRAKMKIASRRCRCLELALSVFLAWWLVPITILLFWSRYLARHEWLITGLHVIILALCVTSALLFYRLGVKLLRSDNEPSRLPAWAWRDAVVSGGAFIAVLAALFFLSFGAIEGSPLRDCGSEQEYTKNDACSSLYFSARLFERLGLSSFVNIQEASMSKKSSTWADSDNPTPAELSAVEGINFDRMDLRHILGTKAFLARAQFRDANLQGADFSLAKLHGADFSKANLQNANLTETFLNEAIFEDAKLQYADFYKAMLKNAALKNATLNEANLREAKLQNATGIGAKLVNAHMDLVEMPDSIFDGADFSGASLGKANLKRARFKEAIFNKAKLGLADLESAALESADLENAVLYRATLINSDLYQARLDRADMAGAILIGADLTNASLRNADLAEAQLDNAEFRLAELQGASLKNVSMKGSKFQQANLRDANLSDANVSGAVFIRTELRGAKLNRARGLTREQISQACVDNTTELPPGFRANSANTNRENCSWFLQNSK